MNKILQKKSKRVLVLIVGLCFLLLVGCKGNVTPNTQKPEPKDNVTPNSPKEGGQEMIPGMIHSYEWIDRSLSLDDFKFLKYGMSLEDVKKVVGKPNGRVGSGILRPMYLLDDDRYIVLVFYGGEDTDLTSIHIVDTNGKYSELSLEDTSGWK